MARIYLDWASAAPVHPRAKRAFDRALAMYGNPSSPHEEGRLAKELLESARTRIARLAGVKSSAVVFTSGATEANALSLQGRIKRCRTEGIAYEDMHIVYLPTMHASVLRALQELKTLGVSIEPLEITNGAVDLVRLKEQLRPQTVLVCIDAVCGETGIRYDTLRVRRTIDASEYAKAIALHVDASQLPLVEPIDRTRLGADMLVLDAQKVGGIRGVGALILPNHALISPIAHGGGQESGLRPGTEPVALIAAFAEALAVCGKTHAIFAVQAAKTRVFLTQAITNAFSDATITAGKQHAPHIVNLSLPGIDTDYLVMLLDAAGFSVSTKSACETDSEDGSKVIYTLTGNSDLAKSTLRISWGPGTHERNVKRFLKALISSVSFLKVNTI